MWALCESSCIIMTRFPATVYRPVGGKAGEKKKSEIRACTPPRFLALRRGMKDLFQFQGRGDDSIESDSIFVIEADVGTVLGVIIRIGAVDFRKCYCRRALADRWSVYLDHPFGMRTSPDLRCRWAVSLATGAFLFKQVSFQLEREEDWMRSWPPN